MINAEYKLAGLIKQVDVAVDALLAWIWWCRYVTNILLRLLHFSMAFVVAVSVQIWHNTLLSRSNCAVATRHLGCVRVLFGSLNAFVGRV